jgi:hypothetical protein
VKDVQLLYFIVSKKKNNNNCKLYIYIRSHSRTSFGNCTSVTKKEKEKKKYRENKEMKKKHTQTAHASVRPTPKNCCFLIIFYSVYNICKMNMYTKTHDLIRKKKKKKWRENVVCVCVCEFSGNYYFLGQHDSTAREQTRILPVWRDTISLMIPTRVLGIKFSCHVFVFFRLFFCFLSLQKCLMKPNGSYQKRNGSKRK